MRRRRKGKKDEVEIGCGKGGDAKDEGNRRQTKSKRR